MDAETGMMAERDGPSITLKWIVLFVILCSLFAVLSILYDQQFSLQSRANNVWFGTDVPRCNQAWMYGIPARLLLHPLSFGLYCAYGKLFSVFGIQPRELPMALTALPLIIYISFCLVHATALLSRHLVIPRMVQFLVLLAFLMVGPVLIFTPVPENHVPGGVSLLVEAVYVYLTLRKYHHGKAPPAAGKDILPAVLFAGIATGFSISNVVPAAIMLLPFLFLPVARRKQLLLSLLILVVIVLGGLFLFRGMLQQQYEFEKNFIISPTLESAEASFSALATSQCGIPPIYTTMYLGQPPVRIMADVTNSPVSVGAFILMVVTIAVGWLRKTPPWWDMKFGGFCLLALLSLVAFHSCYANHEVYLFSPHGTAFVILPGLFALLHAVKRKHIAEIVCFGGALLLVTLRNGMSLYSLFVDIAPRF